MPRDFEIQLERLAKLLAKPEALRAFFANPLITPEQKWFPDRWNADLASLRRLLFRLADYAGLSSLGVEVGVFRESRIRSWLPAILESERKDSGALGMFFGIQEQTAYFGVAVESLGDPDQLVGVLAHEMTHAWRQSMGIMEEERWLEEEL